MRNNKKQLELPFEPQTPLTPLEMVQEFHQVFDADLPFETREAVIREEIAEAKEAYCHFLKEISDLTYVVLGAAVEGVSEEISGDILDEASFLFDVLNCLPEDITHEAFRRVHESNMSKLGLDGKPIKREDGKILKGPNYKEPDLSDLI
jgi:predicted HAD superfamily Cof-like phosphohydrolase